MLGGHFFGNYRFLMYFSTFPARWDPRLQHWWISVRFGRGLGGLHWENTSLDGGVNKIEFHLGNGIFWVCNYKKFCFGTYVLMFFLRTNPSEMLSMLAKGCHEEKSIRIKIKLQPNAQYELYRFSYLLDTHMKNISVLSQWSIAIHALLANLRLFWIFV